MQTETIYVLPHWAMVLVTITVAVSIAGLAIYLVAMAMNRFLNLSAQLETNRSRKETLALDNWQTLYYDEKALHMQDISDLSSQIVKLEKENERMRSILKKTKVADL